MQWLRDSRALTRLFRSLPPRGAHSLPAEDDGGVYPLAARCPGIWGPVMTACVGMRMTLLFEGNPSRIILRAYPRNC